MALVTQQAARLGHPLYVLYIDLATMFPKIPRDLSSMADLWLGLPEEVVRLVEKIFPSVEGHSVQCQYDSAAGLGKPFSNHVGRLMGDVLAPDQAKIFLNTVIIAIRAVVRGVTLWGSTSTDIDGLVKSVLELSYADDWAGCTLSLVELRKFWVVWQHWEVVSGSKVGVKGTLKTAVTGVQYINGVATDVEDPLLPLHDGKLSHVPFLRCDELYKYLGNWRSVSGKWKPGWAKRKGKYAAAIRRIAQMHKPTRSDVVVVADGILGGITSYYGATEYLSWAQAEELEAIFRSTYNKLTGRVQDSLRAELYIDNGCKREVHRTHLYAVAAASLTSTFSKAMADVHNSSQRAAARSALALAMHRWGCRQDPRTWTWLHLRDSIEAYLDSSEVHYLADAFMLHVACGSSDLGGWQWLIDPDEGDPLHPQAVHFQQVGGTAVFEPTDNQGLGATPVSSRM